MEKQKLVFWADFELCRQHTLAQQRVVQYTHSVHTPTQHQIRWVCPMEGWTKHNVDAAIFHSSSSVGLSCVLRGSMGDFIAARAVHIQQRLPPHEAEALSIREALS